jgi:hypothetical protein
MAGEKKEVLNCIKSSSLVPDESGFFGRLLTLFRRSIRDFARHEMQKMEFAVPHSGDDCAEAKRIAAIMLAQMCDNPSFRGAIKTPRVNVFGTPLFGTPLA